MTYLIRVETGDAQVAVKMLRAVEKIAAKTGIPKPTGEFQADPPIAPPPTCGPDENC